MFFYYLSSGHFICLVCQTETNRKPMGNRGNQWETVETNGKPVASGKPVETNVNETSGEPIEWEKVDKKRN